MLAKYGVANPGLHGCEHGGDILSSYQLSRAHQLVGGVKRLSQWHFSCQLGDGRLATYLPPFTGFPETPNH